MATVLSTGGPLKMDVHSFVDRDDNPVTFNDPAVYSSTDDSVATVVNDPSDAQDGIITLTRKVTAPATMVEIKATFAPAGAPEFSVTGTLVVIEPAAAGAQASITGPGVLEGV